MYPEPTSTKRHEIFYSIEEEPKRHKVNEDTNPQIKWASFIEINQELLSNFKDTDLFWERLRKITKYTEDPRSKKKQIYITLENESCICLSIEKKDKYKSEALSQKLFVEKNSTSLNPYFIEIKLFESVQDMDGNFSDKQFLNVRCSENGLLNELVKIEKGQEITGTDGMKIFEEKIVPWFNLRRVYLYDDAQKSFLSSKTNSKYLPMRKCAIFLGDGKSWYEKKGYGLYPCVNMPVFGNLKLAQDSEEYLNAKELIRSTPLNHLYQYLAPFPTTTQKIIQMQKKYLPEANNNSTIHDLVSRILNISQSHSENPSKITLANNDLHFFFENCMKPWHDPDKQLGLQKYLKALNVIEDARIYFKEY